MLIDELNKLSLTTKKSKTTKSSNFKNQFTFVSQLEKMSQENYQRCLLLSETLSTPLGADELTEVLADNFQQQVSFFSDKQLSEAYELLEEVSRDPNFDFGNNEVAYRKISVFTSLMGGILQERDFRKQLGGLFHRGEIDDVSLEIECARKNFQLRKHCGDLEVSLLSSIQGRCPRLPRYVFDSSVFDGSAGSLIKLWDELPAIRIDLEIFYPELAADIRCYKQIEKLQKMLKVPSSRTPQQVLDDVTHQYLKAESEFDVSHNSLVRKFILHICNILTLGGLARQAKRLGIHNYWRAAGEEAKNRFDSVLNPKSKDTQFFKRQLGNQVIVHNDNIIEMQNIRKQKTPLAS